VQRTPSPTTINPRHISFGALPPSLQYELAGVTSAAAAVLSSQQQHPGVSGKSGGSPPRASSASPTMWGGSKSVTAFLGTAGGASGTTALSTADRIRMEMMRGGSSTTPPGASPAGTAATTPHPQGAGIASGSTAGADGTAGTATASKAVLPASLTPAVPSHSATPTQAAAAAAGAVPASPAPPAATTAAAAPLKESKSEASLTQLVAGGGVATSEPSFASRPSTVVLGAAAQAILAAKRAASQSAGRNRTSPERAPAAQAAEQKPYQKAWRPSGYNKQVSLLCWWCLTVQWKSHRGGRVHVHTHGGGAGGEGCAALYRGRVEDVLEGKKHTGNTGCDCTCLPQPC
jgi:hypothetical protein